MFEGEDDILQAKETMEASISHIKDAMTYTDLEYEESVILDAILINGQKSVLLTTKLLRRLRNGE